MTDVEATDDAVVESGAVEPDETVDAPSEIEQQGGERLTTFAENLRSDLGDYDDDAVREAIDRRVRDGEFGNDASLALREYRKLATDSAAERKEERGSYDGIIRSYVRDLERRRGAE